MRAAIFNNNDDITPLVNRFRQSGCTVDILEMPDDLGIDRGDLDFLKDGGFDFVDLLRRELKHFDVEDMIQNNFGRGYLLNADDVRQPDFNREAYFDALARAHGFEGRVIPVRYEGIELDVDLSDQDSVILNGDKIDLAKIPYFLLRDLALNSGSARSKEDLKSGFGQRLDLTDQGLKSSIRDLRAVLGVGFSGLLDTVVAHGWRLNNDLAPERAIDTNDQYFKGYFDKLAQFHGFEDRFIHIENDHGTLSFDLSDRGSVVFNDRKIALESKVFQVLCDLSLHSNEIRSREDISMSVYGEHIPDYAKIVDNNIKRLNKALGVKYTETRYKLGYALNNSSMPVEELISGDDVVLYKNGDVTFQGHDVEPLSVAQFKMLRLFLGQPDRVFGQEYLKNELGISDVVKCKRQLRRKLFDASQAVTPAGYDFIRTEYDVGYGWKTPERFKTRAEIDAQFHQPVAE